MTALARLKVRPLAPTSGVLLGVAVLFVFFLAGDACLFSTSTTSST